MVRIFIILLATMLPMVAVAGKSDSIRHKNTNAALFVASLPVSTATGDTKGDYDKLRKLIGACHKTWQSKYAWDYIVQCSARNDLVAISKKMPNTRFISIPKTDKDFGKLAKPNKILVNVNPFTRSSRDGEIITCYRVMTDGTNPANLPDGPYAVEVCK